MNRSMNIFIVLISLLCTLHKETFGHLIQDNEDLRRQIIAERDSYDENDDQLTRNGPSCVDRLSPICSAIPSSLVLSNLVCCSAPALYNTTCAKTCKFCISPTLPSLPSFGPISSIAPPAPSLVIQQNPCDPTNVNNPPSAGIGTSG